MEKSDYKKIVNMYFDMNEDNDIEYTFLALKPESIKRQQNTLEIVVNYLKRLGVEIYITAPAKYNEKNIQKHYREIYDRYVADPEGKFKFYPELEEYFKRGMIYGLVIKGKAGTVAAVKEACGATRNPDKGTMRYDAFESLNLEYNSSENMIHASDIYSNAKNEIINFLIACSNSQFTAEEIKNIKALDSIVENKLEMTKRI